MKFDNFEQILDVIRGLDRAKIPYVFAAPRGSEQYAIFLDKTAYPLGRELYPDLFTDTKKHEHGKTTYATVSAAPDIAIALRKEGKRAMNAQTVDDLKTISDAMKAEKKRKVKR